MVLLAVFNYRKFIFLFWHKWTYIQRRIIMVVKAHGIISCKECLHKAGEVSFVEEYTQGR